MGLFNNQVLLLQLQSHSATCWLLIMLEMEKCLLILPLLCCPNTFTHPSAVHHPAYLVGEVVAVHFVAVGLTSWTLDLDAMALQDGCFFKNTEPIIEHQPLTTTTTMCGRAGSGTKSVRKEATLLIPFLQFMFNNQ